MKIALGADSCGLDLKNEIKKHLEAQGHECLDLGGSASRGRAYYEVAHELAGKVAAGEIQRGVLCCGTGMGMAIVANKHPGVYAALCEDASSAARARSINNANVLALGGMITAPFKAKEIVDAFLKTGFKHGEDPADLQFLDQSMKDIRAIESSQFSTRDSIPRSSSKKP